MHKIKPTNISALMLAANFFKGNYALSFTAVAIIIIVELLTLIPAAGMIFSILSLVVTFSIQVFFGKAVIVLENEEDIKKIAANTRIGELIGNFINVAAGVTAAYLSIGIVLGIIFYLIFALGGGAVVMQDMQTMTREEMMVYMSGSMGVSMFFLIVIASFLFYVFPAVMGLAIKKDRFAEAFRSIFLLFSPTVWKTTFNKEYLIFIVKWSLILFALSLVVFAMAMSIILFPVVMVIAYYIMLYNAAVYVFAERLSIEKAEEESV
ncbi:hypothetical protein [Nitrosophilus alvini]|uniref:hypothetical protein n=1 Tax=Nitrosophilus alvini TaxID=2714855 RepID=UPI00190C193C|nr:hypothetical protein [Nitrosophilus alvini]